MIRNTGYPGCLMLVGDSPGKASNPLSAGGAEYSPSCRMAWLMDRYSKLSKLVGLRTKIPTNWMMMARVTAVASDRCRFIANRSIIEILLLDHTASLLHDAVTLTSFTDYDYILKTLESNRRIDFPLHSVARSEEVKLISDRVISE